MPADGTPPEFVFTLFTNIPRLAQAADQAGVDRIGIDLERIGKNERQVSGPHWISNHQIEDLDQAGFNFARATLIARVNPLHLDSGGEIEALLRRKVCALILPYYSRQDEVKRFIDLVGGRATVVLLAETPPAVVDIAQYADLPGVDEFHFGLNDLHLALGMNHPFELLEGELLGAATRELRDRGIPFGIGGVARAGNNSLPVKPESVQRRIAALGATRTLLSRSFFADSREDIDLAVEIRQLRQNLRQFQQSEIR